MRFVSRNVYLTMYIAQIKTNRIINSWFTVGMKKIK